MRRNTELLTIALLTSAFSIAASAQDLGRVNFKTSCTPQSQE